MLCACNKKALILTCSTYPFLLQNVVVLFIHFFQLIFFAYSFIVVGNRRTHSHTCSCNGETNVGASECFSRVRHAPPQQTQRMRWIYGNGDFSSLVVSPLGSVWRFVFVGTTNWGSRYGLCVFVCLCVNVKYINARWRRRRRKKQCRK